ncbi:MAG: 50S ribosomal protein L18 [Candidatus Paceibacterota bacterium]
MKKTSPKSLKRERRHARIRARVSGTKDQPRISVFKSSKYTVAQLINDEKGETLAYVSSQDIKKGKTKVEKAKEVGLEIAKKTIASGVKKIVFDRGGFIYTGRIKAVADGAREGGLKF